MRLYLAGPMTGYPRHNIPEFDEVAALLREEGYDVVSPAELDSPKDRAIAFASMEGSLDGHDKTWGDFLARDVKLLVDDGIEGIVVLPGWEKSRGARLETFVAHALCGLPVYYRDPHWPNHLHHVSELALFRAWTQDPTLRIRQAVFA